MKINDTFANGWEREKVNQYDGSETGGDSAQVRKVKRILCESLIAISESLAHHTSVVLEKELGYFENSTYISTSHG